ncbi:MAG: radical SAM protein [Promethearchaeota archaeon]
MIKPVSFRCNLDCKYCYYKTLGEDFKEFKKLFPIQDLENEGDLIEGSKIIMNEAVLKRLIKDYLDLDFSKKTFIWQGGEPLIAGLSFFKRVKDYQNQYANYLERRSGKYIKVINIIQTNGTLINEKWARFFKENDILVGISLDGPKNINDQFRIFKTQKTRKTRKKAHGNMVTFDKIINGVRMLNANEVDYNFLIVLHKYNIHYIREIYNFFKNYELFQHKKPLYLQFIPAFSISSTDNKKGRLLKSKDNRIDREYVHVEEYSISREEYLEALIDLFDLWRGEDFKNISIRFFDSILNIYAGHNPTECWQNKECSNYLLVEFDGSVFPCDFFVKFEWKLGNILNNPLNDLWAKRKEGFSSIKKNLDEVCKRCLWKHLCYGGCIKNRPYTLEKIQNNNNIRFGSIINSQDNKNRTYFCETYKRFYRYSFHWFLDKVIELSKSTANIFKSQFLKQINNIDKCPCGSGLKPDKCHQLYKTRKI